MRFSETRSHPLTTETRDTEGLADALFRQGRFGEAETLYRELSADDRGRLDLRARVGELALLDNRPDRAIHELAAAFNAGLRSRRHIEILAQAYLANREPGSAALCYDRAGRSGLAGTLAAMAHLELGHQTGPDEPHALPWLDHPSLPLIQAEVNGRPLTLLVDTAAGDLLLDREAALAAGVPHGGQEQRYFAGGLPATVTYGHLERLQLGALGVGDLLVQILDLNAQLAGYAGDTPVHGVLGLSVLSRFRVELDWRQRRLVLGPTAPDTAGCRFWMAEGQFPLVQAGPGTNSALWVIDTGMGGAAFAIAEQTDEPAPEAVGMGGGGVVQASRRTLPRLRVNGYERRDVQGMSLPALPLQDRVAFAVEGLLGSEFFSQGRLTLDFGAMTVAVD